MSISVSLPDGSAKELPPGSTVFDLAKAISPRLAKASVLGVVNEQPVDLSRPLADGDQELDDGAGLDVLPQLGEGELEGAHSGQS